MPTQQDFLPFAAAAGSNVLSQSAYAAASATSTGYVSGIASSAALNKSWRQSSIIASMIGDYIVQQVNQPVIDDGTKTTILANFTASIQSLIDAVSNVVVSVTGGTTTLTTTQAKGKVISFSGTLTSPAVIVFPTAFQFWEILNNTTGAFSLTCKTALGSGVTVKQGGIASRIFCDNIGIQFVQNESATVAQFDNSQANATTAFVQRAIGNKSGGVIANTSQTLTAAMLGMGVSTAGAAGPITLTIPNANSFPSGSQYVISNPTAFAITVTTSGTNFLGALGNGTMTFVIPAASGNMSLGVEITTDNINWFVNASRGLMGTMAQFDNGLAIANTAFIKQSGSQYNGTITLSATATLSPAQMTSVINITTGTITLTLPTLASLPSNQRTLIICNANNITFQRNSTDTIFGINQGGASVTSFVGNIGDVFTIVATSMGWEIESGSLTLKSYPQFANSLAASGFQKLPNGLIMQWGASVIVSNTGTVVALPIVFPNNGFSVIVSGANSNQIPMNAYNLATNGFTAIADTATTGSFAMNWVAFGN